MTLARFPGVLLAVDLHQPDPCSNSQFLTWMRKRVLFVGPLKSSRNLYNQILTTVTAMSRAGLIWGLQFQDFWSPCLFTLTPTLPPPECITKSRSFWKRDLDKLLLKTLLESQSACPSPSPIWLGLTAVHLLLEPTWGSYSLLLPGPLTPFSVLRWELYWNLQSPPRWYVGPFFL